MMDLVMRMLQVVMFQEAIHQVVHLQKLNHIAQDIITHIVQELIYVGYGEILHIQLCIILTEEQVQWLIQDLHVIVSII